LETRGRLVSRPNEQNCYNGSMKSAPRTHRTASVYTFLTMTVGVRAGTHFLLDPARESRIGRGSDCEIMLNDPLCSRVHAVVFERDGTWHLRDEDSRNGTFVNDQKIKTAALGEGHHLRVGSTEFSFHQSEASPTVNTETSHDVRQTVVRESPVDPRESGFRALATIQDPQQAQLLLLLYQLTIKLLGSADPVEVVRHALELLYAQTEASLVGFLSVSDDGRLNVQQVLPESSHKRVELSEALTHMVLEQRRAVWIANQRKSGSDTDLDEFADGLCVPMIDRGEVIGAVHVYRRDGRFRQTHFDFAISLANITAVALARARRERQLESNYRRLQAQAGDFDELLGQSEPMLRLKSKIERLARATGCVLIRGESGSGKELVARALHRNSPRADRPMLSVNCAAIPENLMESQLFGHKAGAFTGADREHAGFFQQADLGTLFLDEVGELTLPGQAKLLRVLEGHPFLPVGGTEEVRVDVRVIAATNQDLGQYVREKKFREDLYFRLNVFELPVPPLRERGSDLDLLINHFFDHFRHQHGRPNLELMPEARQTLLSYNWPGNVRQLRNVLDSAVLLAADEGIAAGDLSLRDAGADELETLQLDYWERKLIREALKRTDGNVEQASKLLGLGRATLYRRIQEYDLAR